MDDEEVQFLLELRATTRRTLRALQLQKASFGLGGAPTHIDIGIRQAEKDITLLDAKLQTVQPSQRVTDAIGPVDTASLLLDHRMKLLDERLGAVFTQLSEKMGEIVEQVAQNKAVADQRYDREQSVRRTRQQEHDARTTEMERSLEAFAGWYRRVVTIVLCLSVLALIVSFAALVAQR